MEKNFINCPHCALKGKVKLVQPSTRRTPLISRSDAKTYHLYLEEYMQSRPENWALFRYDLDPKAVRGESSGVFLAVAGNDEEQLEETADLLALILAEGTVPGRQYRLSNHRLVAASGYVGYGIDT
jgi:hypothetical protein